MEETPPLRQRLMNLVLTFLYIGLIGFGGGLGSIGLMEDICVKRRRFLTLEAFKDGLVIANMLPGATGMQMAVYIGYLYAGTLGGLLNGICFLMPGFLLMLGLSWAYFDYGTFPAIAAGFLWIGPVVIAIIVKTLYDLGKGSFKKPLSWVIGVGAFFLMQVALLPYSLNLLIIILVAGTLGIVLYGRKPAVPLPVSQPPKHSVTLKSLSFFPLLSLQILMENIPPVVTLLKMFSEFVKIGFLVFGCGFIMVPFLQQELVNGLHWLTVQQLLDGVALGQMTPGPFLVVATFVGYKVSGVTGAVIATVAVFIPSFLLASGFVNVLLRVRHSPLVQGFLKGVTPAVLGLIAAAALMLGQTAIRDGWTIAIGLVSLLLLSQQRIRIMPVFLILGALLFGMLHILLPLG